ncbi:MAG: HAMP domain-containing histidine kinase [Saccharofermentans sp.]|nr:HAMP domain-containing histidine kinase [Saccharofermentans sp.]
MSLSGGILYNRLMWQAILICICTALAVTVTALVIKVLVMERAFGEIDEQVKDHLEGTDSSAFRLTSSDKNARKLANDLNKELQELHAERVFLKEGDSRMKANVTAISHDIRTPLTAINSYVELLENETDEDKRKEYLERIKERTSELKELTGELFNYSVSSEMQYDSQLSTEELDLQSIIENSLISFYKEFTSKGIDPETDFPSEKVTVSANRKVLMRIFDNVFSNIAKYATSLSVKLTSDAVVTVSNDAPELTAVQVSRLFDKYYTVVDGTNSTGLGLSIAKDLTGKIGGNIYASLNDGILTVTIEFK